MHDLDRTLGHNHMESESLFEFVSEDEASGEAEEAENYGFEAEQSGAFGEAEVNEIAAELLSVSNQQELNNFLGDLIKRAGRGLGQIVSSPLGQQLGGLLKSAAKSALPMVGSALGNALLPGVGGAVGGKLGSMAGSMFGLEFEGLSLEDRQYEAAKQFVRFGGDATQRALSLATQGNSLTAAAKAAVAQAAERYVPGLLAKSPTTSHPHHRLPRSGSWERQGSRIIIHLHRS